MLNDQTLKLDVQDGDRNLTVHIPKMDCITAESFIMRLLVILAKAGIKIPAKAIADASAAKQVAAAQTVAKSPEDILLQLQGLRYEDADELRRDMLAGCQLSMFDAAGKATPQIPLTEQTIRANITSVATLFKIRLAVLKHNFGFLLQGAAFNSVREKVRSSLPNTLIAPRSPAS